MAKRGGLGKGMDALFMDNSVEALSAASAVKLPIGEIEPNREQPRKSFDPEALAELAQSIGEHGVLQPLLVRPMPDGSYRLIAGERRWRASRMAGLKEVPVTVREMTDEEESVFALIENLQREDLNAIEEAEGIKTLIETFGLTQEQASQRLGKSRPAIANALRLLNLPEKITEMVKNGALSMGHARALLGLTEIEDMLMLAERIVKEGLSVREVEKIVKKLTADKKPSASRAKKRDSFYDEVELALASTLGRKVFVRNGKNGAGKLEIEYFSEEDLRKIAKQLDTE